MAYAVLFITILIDFCVWMMFCLALGYFVGTGVLYMILWIAALAAYLAGYKYVAAFYDRYVVPHVTTGVEGAAAGFNWTRSRVSASLSSTKEWFVAKLARPQPQPVYSSPATGDVYASDITG